MSGERLGSPRWYATLWQDDALIAAALLSLRIAAISATLATLLGTAAGYALARFGAFRGRAGLAALLNVPLVLPDVIAGISLLLLFVALQRLLGIPAARGTSTIAIAHATFALAYVAVVVRAQLAGRGTDLEDAAVVCQRGAALREIRGGDEHPRALDRPPRVRRQHATAEQTRGGRRRVLLLRRRVASRLLRARPRCLRRG
jgi:ABC-type Fe3+ transport system permease subunit